MHFARQITLLALLTLSSLYIGGAVASGLPVEVRTQLLDASDPQAQISVQ